MHTPHLFIKNTYTQFSGEKKVASSEHCIHVYALPRVLLSVHAYHTDPVLWVVL